MEQISSILERLKKYSTEVNSSGQEEKEYKCPICKDQGFYIQRDERGYEWYVFCKCKEQDRVERLFESSKITPAFKSKTFKNFDLSNATPIVRAMYECAKDYAENFDKIRKEENNWLVLLGEPGCGKTHLSMAVANVLLNKGIPVLYFQHVEGTNEIKSMIKNENESVHSKISDMKKVDVLIWDDMFKGREKPTDFILETIFEVINYRYLNLLPTIISSEKIPEQLLEIDKAIGSRILERGKGHTVVIEGMENNYRLK